MLKIPYGFSIGNFIKPRAINKVVAIRGNLAEIIDGTSQEYALLEQSFANYDPMTNEWNLVRQERNAKLLACDYTQLQDSGLSDPLVDEWMAYRQSLRNVPQVFDNPFNVIWPKQP